MSLKETLREIPVPLMSMPLAACFAAPALIVADYTDCVHAHISMMFCEHVHCLFEFTLSV